jgi:hypothetical protein
MAAFTFTQTDEVIGTLDSGMKIVSTTITFTSAGESTATTVYVKPLQRIIGFLSGGHKTIVVGTFLTIAAHATIPNALAITPSATNDTGVEEIISFGY